jgi:DNA polymerase III epsilon subunit-like protein
MEQKKIDRRISYKVVLDCESCPLDKTLEGVLPSNMFSYDVGWAVVDKRGFVYVVRSFVVDEIFNKEKELMQSSYYAKKIPMYKKEIAEGKRIVASFYEIRKQLADDMKLYEVKEVYAHNMRFDYGTLNNTQRWLTKSKYRFFFPYGTEICDTLKMSRQVIGKMPTYQKFCEENGYLTKNGRLRFTAEILYRFISKNNEFSENHTGLEDVLIEKEILAYCFKQHKKMVRKLWA